MKIQQVKTGRSLRPLAIAAIAFSAALLTAAQPARGQVLGQVESPAAGTMFLYPERVALEEGGFVTVERGMIFVPANRSKPDSEVIGVEVYRFQASDAADPATPPLFRLHGGPNFQGLERNLATRGWYEQNVQPFLDAADFVVVGQRGIGSSKPTTLCDRPEGVAVDATAEQRTRAQQRAAARCQEYWLAQGLDLSGFTILEAAADVNDVRLALGYDQIQIWGGSFGSHWGMTLMRAYPDLVARAVLRGMEGVDHTYDNPTGVLNAIAGIAAAADTAAALRGHIPDGGLLNALKMVIARLDADPVMVPVEDGGTQAMVRVDGDAVRAVATAGGAAGWPANVIRLHRGDYTAAARAKLRSRRSPGYQVASYFMLDCGSGITPQRAERYFNDPAIAVLGDINWSYRVNCEVWNSDLGDAFRQNFDTDIPTVIVHGNWDTSTPLENAQELEPHFTDLHFVLVKGGSHGALVQAMNADPEFKKQIIEFFATGERDGLPAEFTMPPVAWVIPDA